ncbi:MAG TPA: DciA family protein [Chitinophagales bacterium]|nr:DciA family protein [Chitinophagales bacterium]
MSKRKSSEQGYSKNISMSDALNMFTKENKLDKKLESVRIVETFVSSIPESSRQYIKSVNFSNGIIRAEIESASLRQNLSMASDSLCDIINEKLDQTIVHKILLT